MKTVRKTTVKVKTPRYEVSTSESPVIFATNILAEAQEEAEKLKSEFKMSIHFVDHKQKEHWYYERTNHQKNYRAFQVTYTAPAKEVIAAVAPEDLV